VAALTPALHIRVNVAGNKKWMLSMKQIKKRLSSAMEICIYHSFHCHFSCHGGTHHPPLLIPPSRPRLTLNIKITISSLLASMTASTQSQQIIHLMRGLKDE
jgi:hypothetical protein